MFDKEAIGEDGTYLLATYQPYEADKEHIFNSGLVGRGEHGKLVDFLGFEPVWCLGFRSQNEFVIRSIMALANCPEQLYIFEPPEGTRRVDVQKWNWLSASTDSNSDMDPADIASCFDENTPFMRSEWVVPGIPEDAAAFDINDLANGGAPEGMEETPGAEHTIQSLRLAVEAVRSELDFSYDETDETHRMLGRNSVVAHMSKHVFEQTWARLIACSALSNLGLPVEEGDGFQIASPVLLNSAQMEQITSVIQYSIFHNPNTKGDNIDYDNLVWFIQEMVCSKITQVVMSNYKGVGRNDPCPCGSGKKFKKCHGSWKCEPVYDNLMRKGEIKAIQPE